MADDNLLNDIGSGLSAEEQRLQEEIRKARSYLEAGNYEYAKITALTLLSIDAVEQYPMVQSTAQSIVNRAADNQKKVTHEYIKQIKEALENNLLETAREILAKAREKDPNSPLLAESEQEILAKETQKDLDLKFKAIKVGLTDKNNLTRLREAVHEARYHSDKGVLPPDMVAMLADAEGLYEKLTLKGGQQKHYL